VRRVPVRDILNGEALSDFPGLDELTSARLLGRLPDHSSTLPTADPGTICEVGGSDHGRLAAFPGGHRDGGSPNNLPLELSSFVGREKELAEVGRQLERNRLLTLTGSGGCGKTRLALAVAGEVVEGFEDGVWLVELAPSVDPSLVPQVVASTLGLRDEPGRLPTEALSHHLGSRNVMLILDNCEHLVEACATRSPSPT
jgi:hypothetical protein